MASVLHSHTIPVSTRHRNVPSIPKLCHQDIQKFAAPSTPSYRGAWATAIPSASSSSAPQTAPAASPQAGPGLQTMTQFLASQPGVPVNMLLLLQALQTATKVIAARVARAGIEDLGAAASPVSSTERDAPKALDVVANEVLKGALAASGRVGVMASEEEDEVVVVDGEDRSKYVVVFDPLDGSSNISASIATGTIFGVYGRTPSGTPHDDALQPGERLLAAGYSLYSSATMLVVTTGQGTHGFTLDPAVGEFVLTHPDMRIPARGQYYSLNDARQFDWPAGLQRYVDNIRQGKGASGKQYAARYICSLVADFHRTLLYGGWAANPRPHLRVVYEAAPLAYVCEQAGGRGSDGVRRVLGVSPTTLHQRAPLFLGSSLDIQELESYGDVQQTGKKYDV